MASAALTLAGLARATGISVDDVRFYRDSGLLQPPKRMRVRTDDFAFSEEHVRRLEFIKRALGCGLTHEDIGHLVDPAALLTAGDVFSVTRRRLEKIREAGGADTPAALMLEKLLEVCPRTGRRQDCKILEALSSPDC